MDYTTLIADRSTSGSIKNWVNNPNVPSTEILTDAENELWTILRLREMRAVATITASDGNEYASLPSDYMDCVALKNADKENITKVDWDYLEQARPVDSTDAIIEGEPLMYAIYNGRIEFDVKMDGDQTFKMLYYAKPTALSGANTTNFLTTRYSYLLRAAVLKHANAFLKNTEDEMKWDAMMQRYLNIIAQRDDLSMVGAVYPERF